MPTDDGAFLHNLEVEVQRELDIALSSETAESLDETPMNWQFDPVDVEREEAGLRNLLGAVEAVEGDPMTNRAFEIEVGPGGADSASEPN